MAELDPVTRTIIAEALGEGPEGMRLVGETIVNRAQQRGMTPAEIVAQPYQYTGYESPGPAAVRAFNDPAAVSAAKAAWQLAQGPGDPTGGANHYFNPSIVQPTWANSMTRTLTHGGHAFYTDRNGFVQKADPAQAPNPQTIGPGAIAQRNRVTPQIPAWASVGMNQPAAVQSGALTPEQQATARRLALQMAGSSFVGQEGRAPSTGWAAAAAAGARQPSAFGAFEQGGQDRLMPSKGMAFAGYPVTQSAAMQARRNGNVGPIPATMSASLANQRNGMAVGTQLAVKQAPVPFQRPNFGMGGPGFAPVNAAAMAQAQAQAQPVVAMQRFAPTPALVRHAPVGAMLGMAANGGLMMQGFNGVMNSTTQGSNAWRAAIGDSSAANYRSGGDNDKNPSIGGYFKGR